MNEKRIKQKNEKVEAAWQRIKDLAPEPLYLALRKFASCFDGTEICEWMAGLWDNEIGGFYYSNSARDNDGFLPDLESTSQVLAVLQCSKATSDINKLLPNDVKRRIVDFVTDMQSEDDGFFYHPQWPKGRDKLRSDRYGRDLGSATGLLKKLMVDRDGDGIDERQYPKFCTPSGLKCKKHDGTDEVCDCVKPKPKSACSVKEKVTVDLTKLERPELEPVDTSTREAFRGWLERINVYIKDTPNLAAHFVNTISSEIIPKGYADIVLDFLEEKIEEVYAEQIANGETPTGLWSYKPSFSLAMSVHKYFVFFNHPEYGRPLKYYKEALDTGIEMLLIPENGKKGLNDLMNQWITMTHILNNIKRYHPESLDEMYEKIRSRGVELLECATSNLDSHKLGDGKFVYYMGKSMTPLYGVDVSKGVRESDVNGHLLMEHYYSSVFSVLNYPRVPLCTEEDAENFVEIIMQHSEK